MGSPRRARPNASRLAYAEILTDETGASAATFLRAAVRWFAKLDIRVERVMTDNGSGYVRECVALFAPFAPQVENGHRGGRIRSANRCGRERRSLACALRG